MVSIFTLLAALYGNALVSMDAGPRLCRQAVGQLKRIATQVCLSLTKLWSTRSRKPAGFIYSGEYIIHTGTTPIPHLRNHSTGITADSQKH